MVWETLVPRKAHLCNSAKACSESKCSTTQIVQIDLSRNFLKISEFKKVFVYFVSLMLVFLFRAVGLPYIWTHAENYT